MFIDETVLRENTTVHVAQSAATPKVRYCLNYTLINTIIQIKVTAYFVYCSFLMNLTRYNHKFWSVCTFLFNLM